MATLQSWRRAYGALKDSTKVGLAHVNSDYAALDVAIVKATNHVEVPPKDRHLRKILAVTSWQRPQSDVTYCIHTLSRRLHKTRNWTVALKTLLVIHRLLREGDPNFKIQLQNFSQKGHILQLSNFKDDSSPIAWDYSAWVRTYALFLEERLECFGVLKYDIEAENLPKLAQGDDKGYSKTRELDSEDLLEHLPALQQLMHRLISCRPEGAAVNSFVIQYALALERKQLHRSCGIHSLLRVLDFPVHEIVLKESFKVYCAINDGIINLVDKFFEMPRHEAIKALEIYKRAGQQARHLSDFYEFSRGLEFARNFQFPVLREPPQSFLTTMEEYVSDAPRIVSIVSEPLLLTYRPEEGTAGEDDKPSNDEIERLPSDSADTSNEVFVHPPASTPPHQDINPGDLLGLSLSPAEVYAVEEQNALALALIQNEPGTTSTSDSSQGKDFDLSGWELALVTAQSSDISAVNDRQLGGGLDTLLLHSLYDQAVQQPVYGSAANPFEVNDPFSISNGVAVQPNANNPFADYDEPTHQPQLVEADPTNPFGDSFSIDNTSHQQTQTNPFEATGPVLIK